MRQSEHRRKLETQLTGKFTDSIIHFTSEVKTNDSTASISTDLVRKLLRSELGKGKSREPNEYFQPRRRTFLAKEIR